MTSLLCGGDWGAEIADQIEFLRKEDVATSNNILQKGPILHSSTVYFMRCGMMPLIAAMHRKRNYVKTTHLNNADICGIRPFPYPGPPSQWICFGGDHAVALRLTNKSDSRQAFKVKTSRNDLFKIRPATGIIDYGQTQEVTVTFLQSPNYTPISDRHHITITHIPAPEGASCQGAYAEHYGPPQGEYRLKIFFRE